MRLWILHCRNLCLKSVFFQPAWFLMIMGFLDGFPRIPGKLATKKFTWQTSRCLRYEEVDHLNHQYLGMVIQFSNLFPGSLSPATGHSGYRCHRGVTFSGLSFSTSSIVDLAWTVVGKNHKHMPTKWWWKMVMNPMVKSVKNHRINKHNNKSSSFPWNAYNSWWF